MEVVSLTPWTYWIVMYWKILIDFDIVEKKWQGERKYEKRGRISKRKSEWYIVNIFQNEKHILHLCIFRKQR